MHRRGPLSLSLLLILHLMIGHIPSHMVSSSDYSDDESNAEDDGNDPIEGLSSCNTDQTSATINGGAGDMETGNEEDNAAEEKNDLKDAQNNQKIEDYQRGYDPNVLSQGKSCDRERSNRSHRTDVESFLNLRNGISSSTNEINSDYEFEQGLLYFLLSLGLLGYYKIKNILRRILRRRKNDNKTVHTRSPFLSGETDSSSHQELENFKNALNIDFEMVEKTFKSSYVHVRSRRVYLLLPLRSSRNSRSSPNSLNVTSVEISKSDLLEYLQSKKYQISEVVTIEDFRSGNIQRISADRPLSDIIRETIPDASSTKITVEKINTLSHEGSDVRNINSNTNEGGIEGEVIVISFEYRKTDIDESALFAELSKLKSKTIKLNNFKSMKDSQKRNGSEKTQNNTHKSKATSEVKSSENESDNLSNKDIYLSKESVKKRDDQQTEETREEIKALPSKSLSDDKSNNIELYSGAHDANPMESFVKGRFGS